METSRGSVGTTPWRGLTALHAGPQTVAAMFSQHSTDAMQNSAVNASMCLTNNKKGKASIVHLSPVNQKRRSLEHLSNFLNNLCLEGIPIDSS